MKIFQHLKRGTTYAVLGRGALQHDNPDAPLICSYLSLEGIKSNLDAGQYRVLRRQI
jgi:hypothetical protein